VVGGVRGRFDAPVGAHSPTSSPMARQQCTMASVAKVLPQPGPPVRTITGEVSAASTAARCPSLRMTGVPVRLVASPS